jgi:ribosomal 30S subunit maturation factor RimM
MHSLYTQAACAHRLITFGINGHVRVHNLRQPTERAHTLQVHTAVVKAVSHDGQLIVTFDRANNIQAFAMRVWRCVADGLIRDTFKRISSQTV